MKAELVLTDGERGVPTFGVCESGRVMQYGFLDAVALDGQHCLNQPAAKSNLGIRSTVDLPEDIDGTQFAAAFAARVTAHGQGRPVVGTRWATRHQPDQRPPR
ncbi:hypothetical protein [Streptomyces collinus]|uniref:hypothetical protein n=1 Tax=Streptomyces collinus TaxID=42684 RepID=UPI003690DC1C